MTDLTYKIAAYKEIANFNTDDCIDWAIELLENNVETPNLLILAGLSRPTNYFETVSYLDATLQELGIEPLKGDKAIISYCYYYIKRISESIEVRNNLALVCQFCVNHDYEKNLYDFYLLNWAWGDFDYGETYTDYWNTATKDNIESIVILTAKDWITKHFETIKIKK
jgi:hypothetical protein